MKITGKVKTIFLILSCIAFSITLGKTRTILEFSNKEAIWLTESDSLLYKIISKGQDAGEYQAFPDATRLKNGDIVAVFYAGYDHVSYPNKSYPKAGRICLVRSKDEGRSWTKPAIIFDDVNDSRDPHISQLSNGAIVVSFFSLVFDLKEVKKWKGTGGVQLIWSYDNGQTWDKEAQFIPAEGYSFCSAQVKELPSGKLILPVYHQALSGAKEAWGGVLHSDNRGKTWGKVVPIGKESNLFLPAETDIITLKNGSLYAALRGSFNDNINMQFATSKDEGVTWSAVQDIGFQGHSPSFTRLKTGEVLLTYRAFPDNENVKNGYTGLRISRDEGKSWQGPYIVDKKWGAYPSSIELKDGSVLVLYYEEGRNSAIRAVRLKKPKSMNKYKLIKPLAITSLPL